MEHLYRGYLECTAIIIIAMETSNKTFKKPDLKEILLKLFFLF